MSGVGSNVGSDPEKRLDRVVTVRSGRVAAAAAVIAAVIGAGSGLTAGIVTSDKQQNAAVQQFIREQRQSVYSSVLTDEADLYNKVFDYEHWLNGGYGATVTRSEFVTRAAAVQGDLAKLYKDYSTARIIGSEQAANAAQALYDEENAAYLGLVNDYYQCIGSQVQEGTCPQQYSDADDHDAKIAAARAKFTSAARSDVQGR